ncbi:MAG: ribonuclease J [Patescibacteria group bacterium]|nr:ribonuclease J [Patescibacteria group bacterium]
MNNQISFIPLGGIGDVTKNMYLYIYQDQILIVDCGIGFADETMLGADLLFPDISYLLTLIKSKKIVGMALTHGHEDHIGALPLVLPSLPPFPIYGSPLTSYLANEKLKEFGITRKAETVNFTDQTVALGSFRLNFIRVTHSIPDTSHIFIETPVGNFYHGSDFKLDDTPYDGKKTDYAKIERMTKNGVYALMSDCLGSERMGNTPSELNITEKFVKELDNCKGKFIVTTYSSNISRLNQVIAASRNAGRKICFIGRSLSKTKEAAKQLGYLDLKDEEEVDVDSLRNHTDQTLTLIVAGSQGQESSAMSRIVNGGQRNVVLSSLDTVVFSSDPIPGNELSVYELVDEIAKKGTRVVYSPMTKDFHVSGHGSLDELEKLISLVKPKKLLPIGGSFRHMLLYRNLSEKLGYKKSDVFLIEDGQEVVFDVNSSFLGKRIPVKNVYVDEISGEEMESVVLRDRQRLSEEGMVIVLAEVDADSGEVLDKVDIIVKGFALRSIERLKTKIRNDFKKAMGRKNERVVNWIYVRKLLGDVASKRLFRDLRRRPLVLPIVIEV